MKLPVLLIGIGALVIATTGYAVVSHAPEEVNQLSPVPQEVVTVTEEERLIPQIVNCESGTCVPVGNDGLCLSEANVDGSPAAGLEKIGIILDWYSPAGEEREEALHVAAGNYRIAYTVVATDERGALSGVIGGSTVDVIARVGAFQPLFFKFARSLQPGAYQLIVEVSPFNEVLAPNGMKWSTYTRLIIADRHTLTVTPDFCQELMHLGA